MAPEESAALKLGVVVERAEIANHLGADRAQVEIPQLHEVRLCVDDDGLEPVLESVVLFACR